MSETILATYHTVDQARDVIGELLDAGFPRGDIGLAVYDPEGTYTDLEIGADEAEPAHPGDALVTVTASGERLNQADRIIQAHEPASSDRRPTQWRKDERLDSFDPMTDPYTAEPRRNDES
jgi:hypothetical protein